MVSVSVPSSDWSVDQFKTFLQQTSKKWATDAWYMGKALTYAHKIVGRGDKWQAFLREAMPGVSKATISRYVALHAKVPDPSKLDGKRLNEAYTEAGIIKKTKKNKGKSKDATDDSADDVHPDVHVSAALHHLSRWNKLGDAERRKAVVNLEAFPAQLSLLAREVKVALSSFSGRKAA